MSARRVSPLPLGFAGLAGASLVTAGLQLGWIATDQVTAVGVVLLAFPAPLQAAAAVLAVRVEAETPATTFAVLAGTWAAAGLVHLVSAAPASPVLALLLPVTAVMLAAGAVTSVRQGEPLPAAVLGLASTRFVLDALYGATSASGWKLVSGIGGLAVAALALGVAAGLLVASADQSPARRGKHAS